MFLLSARCTTQRFAHAQRPIRVVAVGREWQAVLPVSRKSQLFHGIPHNRTAPSPPVASSLPSGEKDRVSIPVIELSIVCSLRPPATSHTTNIFCEAAAKYFPSTEKSTSNHSQTVGSFSTSISCPVATFHNLTVPSVDAVASVLPSGEKETFQTYLLCPWKRWISFPLATSQSMIMPSKEQEAIFFPSGKKTTLLTESV